MKTTVLPILLASMTFSYAQTPNIRAEALPIDAAVNHGTLMKHVRGTDERGRNAWYAVEVTPVGVSADKLTAPIHQAAEADDVDTIRTLLDSGFDVDAINEQGRTAFMIACLKGHYDLASVLLEYGAKKDLLDKQGNNLMGMLAYFNKVDGLNFLLQHGFDLEAKDKEGFSPLLRACQGASVDAVKFLMAAGADIQTTNHFKQNVLWQSANAGCLELVDYYFKKGLPDDVHDVNGRTPFMQSCYCAQLPVMRYFLDHGADPNVLTSDPYKSTMPILCVDAKGKHRIEAIEMLLAAGADIEAGNVYGETVLMYASARNNIPMMEMLLNRGAVLNDSSRPNNPITCTFSWNAMDAVRYLIKRGLDVNCLNARLIAPMHYAAIWGNEQALNALLDAGADIEIKDAMNFTPLICAAYMQQTQAVRLLLLRGAEINALTTRNRTALDYAVSKGDYDTCELLIERGADLNGLSRAGFTPLQIASQTNREDIARLLVKHGALIDLKDITGRKAIDYASLSQAREMVIFLEYESKIQAGKLPPRVSITESEKASFTKALFYACRLGNLRRIDQLISSGLNIDAQREEDKQTVLIHCCYAGYEDIATMLINRGAQLELKDKSGNTALLAAASSGNTPLVKLLLSKGAKADIINAEGQSLLHLASRGGDVDLMAQLIQEGAAVDLRDELGQTPLFLACENLQPDSLNFLIEQGAKLDTQRKDGKTALMLATLYGNSTSVYALLDAGADPCLVDGDGNDALILSQTKHWITPKQFSLCEGPSMNRLAICTLLLDFGANSHLKNKEQLAAIDISKTFKHADCESLISQFAQGGTIDGIMTQEQRDRALFQSIERRQWEMVQFYLNHGADVNTRAHVSKEAPIGAAIRQGNLHLFYQLLSLGADPQFRYQDNRSLIFTAARYLQLEMIEVLHDKGVDINAQSKDFGNALHAAYACSKDRMGKDIPSEKRLECLKLLIKLGADPNAAAEGGKSFFETLKQQNQEQLIQELST
ncbi:MAG: ankyrin repeat domain-containing protein [Akkermansia sp.]